ncbi:hypothetical protein ACFVWY_29690 [Streptomyces sp. NPDC058195]|uniref:hypothetical protein n=1 Tax=Streptomyces sp. NPDC058195 TaxID=3346375 RepID=UPI0036E6206A
MVADVNPYPDLDSAVAVLEGAGDQAGRRAFQTIRPGHRIPGRARFGRGHLVERPEAHAA